MEALLSDRAAGVPLLSVPPSVRDPDHDDALLRVLVAQTLTDRKEKEKDDLHEQFNMLRYGDARAGSSS